MQLNIGLHLYYGGLWTQVRTTAVLATKDCEMFKCSWLRTPFIYDIGIWYIILIREQITHKEYDILILNCIHVTYTFNSFFSALKAKRLALTLITSSLYTWCRTHTRDFWKKDNNKVNIKHAQYIYIYY